MIDSLQLLLGEIQMEKLHDHAVIKEVLSTVEKYLEGIIEAEEMYMHMHVVSHACLQLDFPKNNKKDIETNN